MNTAICQVGHPGSLESLVVMLQSVGIRCMTAGSQLRDALKAEGADTIVCPKSMARNWGTHLKFDLPEADVRDLNDPSTLYVDTKAHRNGPRLWRRWPGLQRRTLWYRINGARPCIVPGKGDEIDPPCPVLTPDPWYNPSSRINVEGKGVLPKWTLDKSYSVWPPFARWDDFQGTRINGKSVYDPPVCLTHNLAGWGYGDVGEALMKSIGLRCYGGYGSPHGLHPYDGVPELLRRAICLVHLKSQDCPGYSLYEALASGCPVVVSRMLIDWCQMHSLFEPEDTCLVYDKTYPVHVGAPSVPVDVPFCVEEAERCVMRLVDSSLNKRVGNSGRLRLQNIMWNPGNAKDVSSLADFLWRFFP